MYAMNLFDDPEQIGILRDGLVARGFKQLSIIDMITTLRGDLRLATSELYAARESKNALSREFGMRKKHKEPVDDLVGLIEGATSKIEIAEGTVARSETALAELLATLPNMALDDVPIGDETANAMLRESLAPPQFTFKVRDHVEIGTRMGCMSFEAAADMSGSRFVVLTGALAKLERILGQWMLDRAVENQYREAMVPHLVKANALFGTGQLPKFEDDLFRTGEHYLIPTAEVSLTNLVRNQIIEKDEANWSMRFCALTPCYRAEAGSAGRDTRGLMRMHQFNKVEMVAICAGEVANSEHFDMLDAAGGVLFDLGLPSRTMLLATGDMGFSARKTFDIEVWIPSEQRYREIASISNCGEFQARRMNARWKKRGEKGTAFVHTLNGSGVAVGRALLAIMENYQTEQGGIAIPMVLRPAMGGSLITPDGVVI